MTRTHAYVGNHPIEGVVVGHAERPLTGERMFNEALSDAEIFTDDIEGRALAMATNGIAAWWALHQGKDIRTYRSSAYAALLRLVVEDGADIVTLARLAPEYMPVRRAQMRR